MRPRGDAKGSRELWLLMGPEPDPNDPTPGMAIWGWMTPDELRWLGEQAAGMDSIAEIGVLRGRSAFALLTACPGPVYCIDPWHDPGEHALAGFMEACGHFPNLNAVRGWSPAAAELVPDVDMVFIDGSHDYESVVADINAWLPKTRKLICGHDYCDQPEYGFPGVAQAVHEIFGNQVELAPLTSIWTVRL